MRNALDDAAVNRDAFTLCRLDADFETDRLRVCIDLTESGLNVQPPSIVVEICDRVHVGSSERRHSRQLVPPRRRISRFPIPVFVPSC